jgi:nitroimidazol reductase NimA-like FMN-containing flavoprotein (pyridoxamine 5'-phosphate oxidase superfamily)
MIYLNDKVSRQDRVLEEKRALELLFQAEYGVLSMVDEKNQPYGIPINFVFDGKDAIYFHCALQGKKLISIDSCQTVSFCVVGNTRVIQNRFTTEYESIVLECTAKRNLSSSEKMKALELILDKYCPDHKDTGLKYAEKSFDRTEIVRLDIKIWSGKCKKMNK